MFIGSRIYETRDCSGAHLFSDGEVHGHGWLVDLSQEVLVDGPSSIEIVRSPNQVRQVALPCEGRYCEFRSPLLPPAPDTAWAGRRARRSDARTEHTSRSVLVRVPDGGQPLSNGDERWGRLSIYSYPSEYAHLIMFWSAYLYNPCFSQQLHFPNYSEVQRVF